MGVKASALSRLRHPSVLGEQILYLFCLLPIPCLPEMVEPLEETRTELTFATEPVLCSLSLTIPGVPGSKSSPVDLDEIEVRWVVSGIECLYLIMSCLRSRKACCNYARA
jgi:SCY1-like protein 2